MFKVSWWFQDYSQGGVGFVSVERLETAEMLFEVFKKEPKIINVEVSRHDVKIRLWVKV